MDAKHEPMTPALHTPPLNCITETKPLLSAGHSLKSSTHHQAYLPFTPATCVLKKMQLQFWQNAACGDASCLNIVQMLNGSRSTGNSRLPRPTLVLLQIWLPSLRAPRLAFIQTDLIIEVVLLVTADSKQSSQLLLVLLPLPPHNQEHHLSHVSFSLS